ncbi:MAG: hypothetical protein HDT39_02645 [Lachnospiraceae bacterium]|nr:hypothetical protein [Lachnospiraceae bacterium]
MVAEELSGTLGLDVLVALVFNSDAAIIQGYVSGREIIRVDYTNHRRTNVHSSPHWHEVIWNVLYPKGKNVYHIKDTNTTETLIK